MAIWPTDVPATRRMVHKISSVDSQENLVVGIISQVFDCPDPPTTPVRKVFIETGTQVGDSLAIAMQQKFSRLYSIEWNYDNHTKALRRFEHNLKSQCACCGFQQELSIHHGSSPELLPRIIDPTKDTTFWLDAHFVSENHDEMDRRYGQCPLLEELRIICSFTWTLRPCVLIDDTRMYVPWGVWSDEIQNPNFKSEQWPTLNEIMNVVTPQGFIMKIIGEQIWLW